MEAWSLRRGFLGVDSRECQVKELGLYFVGGGVPSIEFNSRSVLSDLNLESSARWQFVDGFEGNKIGIGRVFHRQTGRIWPLSGLEMESGSFRG